MSHIASKSLGRAGLIVILLGRSYRLVVRPSFAERRVLVTIIHIIPPAATDHRFIGRQQIRRSLASPKCEKDLDHADRTVRSVDRAGESFGRARGAPRPDSQACAAAAHSPGQAVVPH